MQNSTPTAKPRRKTRSAVLSNVIPFPRRNEDGNPEPFMDETGIVNLAAWLRQGRESISLEWFAHDRETLVVDQDGNVLWRIRRAA